MKKLKFKKPESKRYYSSCEAEVDRIIRVCAARGYSLSETDAVTAWERFSEDYYAAGWLILPFEDEELFNDILVVMEPEE